jgi:hypothetical protein
MFVVDLRAKVEQIALRHGAASNWNKVFNEEDIDLTKLASAQLAASASGVASGPISHQDDDHYWRYG